MRVIIFCDEVHIVYFNIVRTHLIPEIDIVRTYLIGDEVSEDPDSCIYSVQRITDKVAFDAVFFMYFELENVIKDRMTELLPKIYGDDVSFPFYNLDKIMHTYLDSFGEMECARTYLKLHNKDGIDFLIGDFSYYTSVHVHDEKKDGDLKVIIGKFCSIGPEAKFMLAAEHSTKWNTTYPFDAILKRTDSEGERIISKGNIIIGNDVWIGENVTFMSGITIGDGCVIGSNAVVTKSFEPYSIIVGNPAKVVKRRFDDSRIEKLLEMKWWDWELSHIHACLGILQSEDTDKLFEYYKKHIENNTNEET